MREVKTVYYEKNMTDRSVINPHSKLVCMELSGMYCVWSYLSLVSLNMTAKRRLKISRL